MLRSRTLARTMGRLALIAVLLLAIAPSISRVLAGGSSEVLAGWSQLCTSMGLKTLPTGDAGAMAGVSMPSTPSMPSMPSVPDGHGDSCDYCPLAASLPMVLLASVFLLPAPVSQGPILHVTPRLRAAHNLRGLGSRGPPILL